MAAITYAREHGLIEFSILERSHPVNTGRGGKGRNSSWNTRRLSKGKLRDYLEESRLIYGLGWAKSAGSLGETVRSIKRKVVAACDYSMSRRGPRRTKGSMFWWNDQLFILRREFLTARRKYTRSKGDDLLREA